jgi:hypothetical protein
LDSPTMLFLLLWISTSSIVPFVQECVGYLGCFQMNFRLIFLFK